MFLQVIMLQTLMWAVLMAANIAMPCFMKRFTNHNEPWGSFLDVKIWPQINAQKYAHKKLIVGTVTNASQPSRGPI